MTANNLEPVCCPEVDTSLWHDKTFHWEEKKFIKDRVCTFFYMPVNFGKVMRRLMTMIGKASAVVEDNLCLSDHTSKWKLDVYVAVDRNVENAENITLNGRFYARAYEGPFKDTGKWCKDYEANVSEKGWTIKKWFMWYTTCPKCAKKYGKNPVIIICEIN